MAKLTLQQTLDKSLKTAKQYIDTELEKKSDSSHTHNYAGSSSAGGAANSVKTNLIIKLNGGSTEDTNQFTFNGSSAKTVNITPSSIGAFPSSGGALTGYINLPATATSTNVNHPTQLAYGLLGSYGTLKVLGNTDTSAGADNEYVHIAAGWGLSPTTDKGIVVYGTYAQCFGQNILTATHTASHAPANAQKNSDITKAEIEAKLTGTITSHSHSVATTSANGYMSNTDKKKVDILSEGYDKILFERFERGNITGNNPVTLNDFTDKPLIERYLVNDFLAYSVGEYYLGRLTTYLYFSAASDFTTTAYSDDGSTIYLNEKMVASILTCANTEITLNFKKGWNKLVWVFNENTGGDTCTLTPAIRTATNFQYMNAYGSGTTTNDTINGLSLWTGTQAQYDAITTKSATTVYLIKQ